MRPQLYHLCTVNDGQSGPVHESGHERVGSVRIGRLFNTELVFTLVRKHWPVVSVAGDDAGLIIRSSVGMPGTKFV